MISRNSEWSETRKVRATPCLSSCLPPKIHLWSVARQCHREAWEHVIIPIAILCWAILCWAKLSFLNVLIAFGCNVTFSSVCFSETIHAFLIKIMGGRPEKMSSLWQWFPMVLLESGHITCKGGKTDRPFSVEFATSLWAHHFSSSVLLQP